MLVVNVDRPTGIVRIDVSTRNRQLSALVTRRLLDLVNEFNLRRRQSQAGAEREFDARRARAALDTLRSAEAALADFRAGNIDFSRSPRLGTREAEFQRRVALAQQIYTTVAQRYEVANIEAVRNTPVVTVLDAPEGLVEARPRYTLQITAAAFIGGLLLATALALGAERLSATR
jgi:capsule polysaccharide export protein KpsE/RkpR